MANTLSACGYYGIYVALQHLCGSMCQEWSDAEPALLSRCIEGSDVLNASGICTQILLASCGSTDLVPLVSLVVVCLS